MIKEKSEKMKVLRRKLSNIAILFFPLMIFIFMEKIEVCEA